MSLLRSAWLRNTALFLHKSLPGFSQYSDLAVDPVLANRKVLIIDYYVPSIFALTSLLEQQKMRIAYAESAADGIEPLETSGRHRGCAIYVMMPDMDGYQAMQAIREMDEFRLLPIIALTAKAMKGDREKCVQAGATDYTTKPVSIEELLSLLRIWLAS